MKTVVVETLVAAPEELASKISSLDIQEGDRPKEEPKTPPHRSHDPQDNQKKVEVPQFGSRYLNESDDVFEFNAWDHVETDDTYKEYSEKQYAMQRQSPVSPFEKSKSLFFFFLLHISWGLLARATHPASVMIYKSIVHLNYLEDKL